MRLEKMDAFFAARLNGYDEHMMMEIEGAKEFYPYTAALLPLEHDVNVLDLGCGTGLELEYYFTLNGKASVVGIDLSADMLEVLKRKFSDRKIKLICVLILMFLLEQTALTLPYQSNRSITSRPHKS